MKDAIKTKPRYVITIVTECGKATYETSEKSAASAFYRFSVPMLSAKCSVVFYDRETKERTVING